MAAALRAWFAKSGFIEVETAALQVSPGNETHLHAFATDLIRPDTERRGALPAHLAGIRLQEAARRRRDPDFRFRPGVPQSGARRAASPEFTLLEWYRANEPYEMLMDDCAALMAEAATAAGTKQFSFRGKTVDPFAAPERLTVAEAFARYAGVDLLSTVTGDEGDRDALRGGFGQSGRRNCGRRHLGSTSSSRILAERVDSHLGLGRATLLYEYPLPLAALARPKPGSDKVAERFELYACGVELGNAFGELTDVAEQRKRFETAMAGKATHPWRALSDRRGIHGRARGHAAGFRHRARLRPAGDAGDGVRNVSSR